MITRCIPLRMYAAATTLLTVAAIARGEEQRQDIRITGSAGAYSLLNWKQDWPGCQYEDGVGPGRVTVIDRDAEKWLRVNYAVGEIGPDKNGAGWRYPIGTHETVELRYSLRFSPNFDWVKGGKLPGLCGGPMHVSGGRPANGKNGFSARLMWRKEGRGEAYVYHKNQPSNFGESFSFPAEFRFPRDEPILVRMRVTMNDVGQRNGSLRVWITVGPDSTSTERLMIERNDMEWRTVDNFGVDSVDFETFHGGGDKSWAPQHPSLDFSPGIESGCLACHRWNCDNHF